MSHVNLWAKYDRIRIFDPQKSTRKSGQEMVSEYTDRWYTSKNDASKNPENSFTFGKGYREIIFLDVTIFQVVLVFPFWRKKIGESLWGPPRLNSGDSWGNERLRTEKARQARIQFQVKVGGFHSVRTCCFSSKDTKNSKGTRLDGFLYVYYFQDFHLKNIINKDHVYILAYIIWLYLGFASHPGCNRHHQDYYPPWN